MSRNIQKKLFCVLFVLIAAVVLSIQIADAQTEDEQNNIDVYRQVSPGVVNITSVVMRSDFFLNPVPQEGAGSGAIVDPRGYILTNNHVIKDAQMHPSTRAIREGPS